MARAAAPGPARHRRRGVPDARPRAGRSARRRCWRRCPLAGDARRVAVGGARGARSRRAAARAGHRRPARCWPRPRSACSTTRSSTRIRGSSATSPPRRRRSASSAICSRRRSTPTSARWRAVAGGDRDRSADRPLDRRADRLSRRRAAGCWSAAATWPTSCASWRRARRGAGWDVREEGLGGRRRRGCASTRSAETHTWIQKAADLSGLGTDAIRWIPTDADQRMDVDALRRAHRGRRRRRRRAAPGRRHGRLGEHRRGRSAAGDRRASAASTASGSTSTAPTAGSPPRLPDAPADLRGTRPRRLGRRRSAQVAVRAARGRLRAGPRRRAPARRVRLPSAVLPLRRARHELRRLRAAELARLPRAEGVAGAAAGRRRRLPHDDRRRHAPGAGAGRRRAAHAGARAAHAGAEHHDVPLRAGRARGRGSATPAVDAHLDALNRELLDGCSAAASCSSRTRSSAAATCCAPAS